MYRKVKQCPTSSFQTIANTILFSDSISCIIFNKMLRNHASFFSFRNGLLQMEQHPTGSSIHWKRKGFQLFPRLDIISLYVCLPQFICPFDVRECFHHVYTLAIVLTEVQIFSLLTASVTAETIIMNGILIREITILLK